MQQSNNVLQQCIITILFPSIKEKFMHIMRVMWLKVNCLINIFFLLLQKYKNSEIFLLFNLKIYVSISTKTDSCENNIEPFH